MDDGEEGVPWMVTWRVEKRCPHPSLHVFVFTEDWGDCEHEGRRLDMILLDQEVHGKGALHSLFVSEKLFLRP